jgi:PAS domain S-box-containing protein
MPRKSRNPGTSLKKAVVDASIKKVVSKKSLKTEPLLISQRVDELTSEVQRLNVALEAAGLGIWEWDILTNAVKWSDNVYKILGLAKNAFDGKFETYLNLIHPDDKPNVIDAIDQALKTSLGFVFEHRMTRPDGLVHWIESKSKLIFDSAGKPLRLTGTVQDITAKKTIEIEREDWKTRLELISTSAGLVVYDYNIPSGNIVWSGNSVEVLEYAPEELGNIDRWVELIHPEDRDEAFALLEAAQQELRPYDVHYRFSKKNGGFCYMHDRGFFIPDIRGVATRMLGMMSDVSERFSTAETIKENVRFRRSIEKTMPGILYVHDLKKQRTIYNNKEEQTSSAYSAKDLREIKGDFVSQKIHPEDLKKLVRWTNESHGVVRESEYRVLMKDNQYRWFYSRDTPFQWDEEGNVVQIIGIAQDITARKEALEQLHNSEQSYRELFDTVGEGILILGTDGIFIDANAGASTMYGYTKEELVGRTPGFLADERKNDFEFVREKLQKAAAGELQKFEFWARRKNGTVFPTAVSLTRGSYFGKTIIIATSWDITEQRNSEQALRESEQRFRKLQQASFGGIGLHDNGVIIDCNQGLSDITGYTHDELIGMYGVNLMAPEYRDEVINRIRTGYEKPYDVEGIMKDGTRYIVEIQGKNIPFEGRNIRVTEFRNITDRKRTEEKIIEQNSKLVAVTESLKRKNDQLEEFTQIVSHNLRSPVGNIVTLLSFFESAASEDEKKEYLHLLKESSAMTLYMLNDLNEVLKVKQNKNIEKQDLQFETVLKQVFSMLNAKISKSNASITFDFDNCPTILYPNIYLESILLNLLDNALKYCHPDRIPTVIFRTYANDLNQVVLEVTDNGLGLNLQKYGHHIFKLRKTFHRHPESRGIGLFMIKNQIEAMGGEINMESKESEGSTFFINFSKYVSDDT